MNRHNFCLKTSFCLICGCHISMRWTEDCHEPTAKVVAISHLRAVANVAANPDFDLYRRMRVVRRQREDIESDIHEARRQTEGLSDSMTVKDMLAFIRKITEVGTHDPGPQVA